MAGKNISSSAANSEDNSRNNLYAIGGPLTNTIKPSSEAQMKQVAINSGIQRGPVDSTNTWPITNDGNYGVNLEGPQMLSSNPVNDGY